MDSSSLAPQAAAESAAPGLQARKKLAAMHRIQAVALDLFEERGFDQVGIEAVAAGADVSPRTVYRYFGTKEMLVIWDEADEHPSSPLAACFASADPIGALRAVLGAGFAAMSEPELRTIRRRLSLVFSHQAIEAALVLHSYEKSGAIVGTLAPNQEEGPERQIFVHAFIGASIGAMRHWWRSGFAGPPFAFVDRALALLEHGFTASTLGGART
jgi:AcrR family transcriptional regulator